MNSKQRRTARRARRKLKLHPWQEASLKFLRQQRTAVLYY